MKKDHFRQFRSLSMLLVSSFLFITVSLSGCSSKENVEEMDGTMGIQDTSESEEWVYIPEFISFEEENIDYDGMRVAGNNLCYLSYSWNEEIQYYTQFINTFSLENQTKTSYPIIWPDGPGSQAIIEYTFGDDGCLYVIALTYPRDSEDSGDSEGSRDSENPELLLCKFDLEGTQVFSLDIAKQLWEDPDNGLRINAMEIDGQNRIYIADSENIWLYDDQGQYQGKIFPGNISFGEISPNEISSGKASTGNQSSVNQSSNQNSYANLMIDGLHRDGEGKVFVSYGEAGYSSYGYTLAEIDFEGKSLTLACMDFPSTNTLSPNQENGFLMQDHTYVYTYDPAAQEQGEILFGWMDCDIAGSSVLGFGQIADGRIAAVLETQERSGELALLTRVSADQVVPKENLVLGVLMGGYNYEPAVVRFNRSNEKYHIELKEYYHYGDDGITLEDALTRLNAEIVSEHCPDLLEVTGLNLSQLAAKDAFQDLLPYLEKSSTFSPEDFMGEILDAYTFEGKLTTIPYAVFLQTVMGNSEQVGAESDWTMEKVISLAETNPDAELFDGADRDDIMNFLMEYGEDSFVDWDTGKCSFDSEQFKSLLEFVKGFPETVEYNPDQPSTPTRVQNGEVLLKEVELYDFNSIQIDLETFGSDAVCIGYPTVDGGRHNLTAIFSYAITSRSKQKDGAWAFIESILMEENGSNGMGFPTVKERLENAMEDAISVEYILDEDGNVYLDENGDPLIMGNTSTVHYGDGWSYTYHTATREEAELVLSLLTYARPAFLSSEDEIRTIISEESETFFSGQKTVEEVAGIIQNRVNNYVNENR